MMMTNYMDLLAANSPWNLILFMVIPVAAAEAMVAAEFYMLYRKDDSTQTWQKISKALGIFSGIYFAAVVVYLIAAVIPSLHWRGIIDEIAIFFYLLGIFPLGAITLLELGAIGRSLSERERMRKHFQFLIGFLIVSHIAMIFGMANPTLSGWRPSPADMPMNMNHTDMGHMDRACSGRWQSSGASDEDWYCPRSGASPNRCPGWDSSAQQDMPRNHYHHNNMSREY